MVPPAVPTVSVMITVGRQGFCSAVGSFPRIRLGSLSVSIRSAVFSLSSSPPPEKTNLLEIHTHIGAVGHDDSLAAQHEVPFP